MKSHLLAVVFFTNGAESFKTTLSFIDHGVPFILSSMYFIDSGLTPRYLISQNQHEEKYKLLELMGHSKSGSNREVYIIMAYISKQKIDQINNLIQSQAGEGG